MARLDCEKELEDYFVGRMKNVEGLTVVQQAKLDVYGTADTIAWGLIQNGEEVYLQAFVVEFKKGPAGYDSLAQLCRYMTGVMKNLNNHCKLLNEYIDGIRVQGYLVCSELQNKSEMGFLLAEMEDVEVIFHDLTLDGVQTQRFWGWTGRAGDEGFMGKSYVPIEDLYEKLDKLPKNDSPPLLSDSPFHLPVF